MIFGRTRAPSLALGSVLILLLALPAVGLLSSTSLSGLMAGVKHPSFVPALLVSFRTTVVSVLIILGLGTPLAWWLAGSQGVRAQVVEGLVDLPVVLPPSVVGIALLQTYGGRGLLGPTLDAMGWNLPFTSAAVVMAQVVVASPFYVRAAVAAFRRLDEDLFVVARTLGASPTEAVLRVALPMSAPALAGGLALAWARAVGEFGATLLFAGNRSGVTQTMPLAIYSTLEVDIHGAVALALLLAALSALVLAAFRGLLGRAGQR
ncbi:MAG: molybdate ABC transporter permease subunit [Myxococcota bacterium]